MTLTVLPVAGIAEIHPGDDLAGLLAAALAGMGPTGDDVLVVTHKVVSKSEGAVRRLADEDADAYRRLVQEEAMRVLRRRGELVIAETRHGFICANAGVDRSNVEPGTVVLLPEDPDRSARRIRDRIGADLGVRPAVIITDTFGRPWRRGVVDVAIGVAGMAPILDLRGTRDGQGRVLDVTEVNVADELAAAADLVMGKASGICAALIKGVTVPSGKGTMKEVIRPPAEDLFR